MSNLEFYYKLVDDRWYMEFNGDVVLSCSNFDVEKEFATKGCYQSPLQAFKAICAREVMELIDNVELMFSTKWFLTKLFKSDMNVAKGGN